MKVRSIALTFIVIASLYFTYLLCGQTFTPFRWPVAIISAFSLFLVQPPRDRRLELLSAQPSLVRHLLSRWLLLLAALLGVGYLTESLSEIPRPVALMWAAITPAALIAAALAMEQLIRRIPSRQAATFRRAVLAGCSSTGLELAQLLARDPAIRIQLTGFFDDRNAERLPQTKDIARLGELDELAAFTAANNIDMVFIALPLQRVVKILDDLRNSVASVYYVPDIALFEWISARPAEIQGIPLLAMVAPPLGSTGRATKRVMDVLFSSLALLALAPLMLLISIAIKAESAGPVLFRQRRYGLNGQEILVYKFRTMRVAEEGPSIVQSTRSDRRITRFGQLLRRTSIDELPQLFNVLQGSMSLVGPRPHAVATNEIYRKLIHGYMSRHRVKPGITGLAQVNGLRGETDTLELMQLRVQKDLDYVRNWSPWLDLQILARTITLVMRDDRAY